MKQPNTGVIESSDCLVCFVSHALRGFGAKCPNLERSLARRESRPFCTSARGFDKICVLLTNEPVGTC